ncbi:hypothetical protein [Nocardia bovistercoris]|uniref:Uncharacterized protein n=1 Tax=Nocardia bovistercoris TaxID=2785916 RepID=A0A931IEA4_9NOCA|nr:hypothetical protein [Nocardia bovistercoris]MBH0778800.1 hypothetical protein [Nocardia bovistercoris]
MDNPRAVLPLPYTRPPLHANKTAASREAKLGEARIRRDIRAKVVAAATLAHLPRGVDHVVVELHWQPEFQRARDTDNLMPTLKPIADALTPTKPGRKLRRGGRGPDILGYGMVRDDTPRWMTKPEAVIHDPVPGEPGRVWVELDWTSGAAAETGDPA